MIGKTQTGELYEIPSTNCQPGSVFGRLDGERAERLLQRQAKVLQHRLL
jgi:hypothetical protein